MDTLLIVVDPLIRITIMALQIYLYVVIASVILSWLVAFDVVNMRNRFVYAVGSFVNRATEPVLRPIRRFLPNLGGIDLSPLVLLLLIYFVQMVLQRLLVALLVAAG
ncbi:MAG: YggT family protein [Inquilinus sp.]|nr:YggT family protein [Inquilinus sp.]